MLTLVPTGKVIKYGGKIFKSVVTKYLVKSSINAFIDVFAQLTSNDFDFSKVDWIDVGVNFLPPIPGGKNWKNFADVVYRNIIEAGGDYTIQDGLATVPGGEKRLSEAGIEVFVGIVFDATYSKFDDELKVQMEKIGMDPKKIESKIAEVMEKQREIIKEVLKTNSQDKAKTAVR